MHDTDEECAFCKKPFTKEQRECLREIYKHTHNKKEESEPTISAIKQSTAWEQSKNRLDQGSDII